MEITYNTLTVKESKPEIFKLCKNRKLRKLYVLGGQLKYVYKLPNVIRVISIAYVGELPIGVSFLLKKETHINTLQLYVKPEYRKLGIGSQLVKNLIPYFVGKETHYVCEKNEGFYRKIGDIL